MFVGGIECSVSQAQLFEYFSQFAALRSVKLIGVKNRVSRGFAFIEFVSEDQMKQVCQERHEIMGKVLDCKPSVKQEDHDRLEL